MGTTARRPPRSHWLGCSANPYVSTVLISASKPHPLEDNLGAVNLHLTADEVYALNDLTRRQEVYPAWFTRDIGPNGVVDYALTDATAATWPEAPPSS